MIYWHYMDKTREFQISDKKLKARVDNILKYLCHDCAVKIAVCFSINIITIDMAIISMV